ncbi:uncharacterized protein LOC106671923 [Cimex lectularius]|uniref:Uncharacterized protein n=1 Tax=Cimex lectularius TaxID=79782 RepID=A0A8I6TGZ1_CIMLE|nr:uncharacterized protein LOC106671923 [Cimex lectularius]
MRERIETGAFFEAAKALRPFCKDKKEDEKGPVFKYIDMIFVVVLEMVRQLAMKTKKLHRRLLTYNDGTLNVKTSDGREIPAIKYLEEQIQIENLKKDLDKAFTKLKMDVQSKLDEVDDCATYIEESVRDEDEDEEEDEEENEENVCSEFSENDTKSMASTSPGSFHVDQKKTFGRRKTRDIAVENMRLAERLAKMRGQSKPKPIFPRTVVASSAINRKKMQWEIERKNAILARRIADAKSCLTYKDS